MPKSKRNKVVALTKTGKKGREAKTNLLDKISSALATHKHMHIVKITHMRNNQLQQVRTGLKEKAVFFFGKNKVAQKAILDVCEPLAQRLKGDVALCLSSENVQELKTSFAEYVNSDFARNGSIANYTVILPAGPVFRRIEAIDLSTVDESLAPSYLSQDKDEVMAFPNNMETQLRGLGMPTLLKGGVITLMKEYTICSKGDTLSSNQAQLLKHFNLQMAQFNVRIIAHWSDETGFESFDDSEETGEEDANDEDMGDEDE